MAINTAWRIEVGTLAAPTDFTSRVQGVSIDQQVDVNVIGRGTATITLLNKDGALTPGGGGTYGNTDWFAQGVFITARTDVGGAVTSTPVFHGVVIDFDLVDDGVFSTVTLTCADGLTVGGKSTSQTVPNITGSYDAVLGFTFALGFYGNLYLPKLGEPVGEYGLLPLNNDGATPNVTNSASQTFSTFADTWQTALIPAANDVMWASRIVRTPGVRALYYVRYIPFSNTRLPATTINFTFDPSNAISGTDLPFDTQGFAQAFNNDTLITEAVVKGGYAGATNITVTGASSTTYGSRAVQYTNTFALDATATTELAQRLVNRYSTARFQPVQLRLSASQVRTKSADAAHANWYGLLSIETGLWQRAAITWQGSGAASQTAYCVIKGRRIEITPSDTTVTLTLGNWADNHGFILDTDQLNTDKLG